MTLAGERRADDLREYVAEDFYEVGASGQRYSKAEVLAALERAPLRRFMLANFKIVAGGKDWALVSYRAGERSEIPQPNPGAAPFGSSAKGSGRSYFIRARTFLDLPLSPLWFPFDLLRAPS